MILVRYFVLGDPIHLVKDVDVYVYLYELKIAGTLTTYSTIIVA